MVSVMKTMRYPQAIPLLCLVLLAAALLTAGCTNTNTKPVQTAAPTPVPETTIPPTTTAPISCGLTSCHGLDLACGSNPPDVCTMEYKLGDRCRKYAHCDASGGSCTLVKDSGFVSCKNCVEDCEIRAGDDTLSAVSCEEKC